MSDTLDEIERRIVRRIRRRQWMQRLLDGLALCGLTILIVGGIFSAMVIIHLFQ